MMHRIKCSYCGQTLCFANIMQGQMKCPRCGTKNDIEFIRKEKKKIKSKSQ
ncbi:MAG: Com family DNA-binding transcriptional regulator [Eubacterium sp.]|nr:Com family DNA-binding transcriptional regulator [Eubacterium sp.]